jgi:hypothetical protein
VGRIVAEAAPIPSTNKALAWWSEPELDIELYV